MNDAVHNRRVYTAGVVAIIIVLLLLFWRRGNRYVDARTQAPGAIVVSPTVSEYEVGPLRPVGTDFDWMQTTNLGCDCDEVWNGPAWEAPEPILVAYPVYRNAGGRAPYLPTTINATFAVYAPPPPLTWWFDVLLDVDGVAKSVRHTSDNEWFRLGKYGTFARDTHRYTEYQVSGADLYWGTRHYIHDGERDTFPPAPKPKPALTYYATSR